MNDEAARQWKMQNGIEDLMIERLEELGIPNKEKEEDLLEQRYKETNLLFDFWLRKQSLDEGHARNPI